MPRRLRSWLAAPGRGAGLVVAVAIALFLALGYRQSEAFMVWSEETMVHSRPAPVVLGARLGNDGRPQREPSCASADSPLLVLSDGRPRLSLCAQGRTWPVMIAPYFAGFFYWPFALFAPLHHDNVLLVRKLGLLLAVASILATYAVVARLAGRKVAAVGALSTAVAPCFVMLHAILVHFETLPWLFLMLALLAFIGCPGLAPPAKEPAAGAADRAIPTLRLLGGSFLTGCAIIANVKTIVLIAPLVVVAWRLRVPGRRIGARRWLGMGVAALVPLLPLIALTFAPTGDYGDKSSGWQRTLFAHLTQPERILSTVRDLVLVWSNVPFYFAAFARTSTLNVASAAVATAALGFVLADAARTLVRREGCAIAAGCGACIASYALMVMLLYEEFPANFTPLHSVYALAVAVTIVRLAERLSPKGARSWVIAPIAAAALIPFAWNVEQTERATAGTRLPTNTRTELALVAYLLERPEPGLVHVTVDTQLSGVVDSLSNGRVRTIQADNFIRPCRPYKTNPDAEACLDERWRQLLPSLGSGVVRVIMPADFGAWGSKNLDLAPALARVAAGAGYALGLERSFPAAGGAPGIVVYRAVPVPAPTR